MLFRDVCNEEVFVVLNFFDSVARLFFFSFVFVVGVEFFDLNNLLNDFERCFRSFWL